MHLRSDKCLRQFPLKPMRLIPADRLDNAWAWWGRYRDRSRAKASRCMPVPRTIWDAFLCIHSHEGAWNSNTGNGYWGGLQMDPSFMASYGSDMIAKYGGYAHLWSPADQIIVGYRAWKVRGFTPWPNTAAMCGLL